MLEIVLDTETTGLDPRAGHRVVEIGCVELEHHVATGRTFHQYINPERDMPTEAYEVHGLSTEFLAGHPLFSEIVDAFLAFIGSAPLVIHNAAFDMKFLNAELEWAGRSTLAPSRAVDTLDLARRRYPGAQASLDALCRRFEIDNSARTKHGALLDAELLAEVYLELRGGREPAFALNAAKRGTATATQTERRPVRPARPHAANAAELRAHEAFLDKLQQPIWRR
ncbi:MAG: DNA polymerase III subunit epsilon [Alphaproteobacteria bacterium]|nr:DNA polymerase III subunit epsilon [Alphaproteobacteria bacterium]